MAFGAVLGYFARQSIARKRADTIETTLQKKIAQVKKDSQDIISKAKEKASQILEKTKEDTESQKRELFKAEKLLLKKENILGEKSSNLDEKEKNFYQNIKRLKEVKQNLDNLKKRVVSDLEKVSGLSKEGAKKELFKKAEKDYQREIMEKMQKLEQSGNEKYQEKAKEILALAIQKCAFSQAQELTTTTVNLPSEDIKGRIIGKEGRNIRALEQAAGVEVMVDETPEVVVISGFDPIRRQIAKIALEKLIQDGRIQPARIEDTVKKVESEIVSQIKKAGEKAVYETGIVDLDPKIVHLLGRLRFRTSYGQNVLLHSLEVSHLASALAAELGADSSVARKAGLLHDIGKAVDHQVQGSHTDIGIKILEKFGVEEEVIKAMKSHHEEYPAETLEAILVEAADQISGSRPGARKDTLENYLKRIEELEGIAASFPGVEKAYAIQAGREVRVFIRSEEVDDFGAKKIAREIAKRVQEELKYPGEIKVVVIRENRVIEYAR